jgi:hypothetical protein
MLRTPTRMRCNKPAPSRSTHMNDLAELLCAD